MTLDGYCDHTAVNAGEEIHRHYTGLLAGAEAILYGRTTYQLMEFWPPLVKNPSENAAMDEFAKMMDEVPKTVFSRTLKSLNWHSAQLSQRSLEEELKYRRQQSGKAVYLGSPSLIVAGTNLSLIDEYQICIHPVIAGKGQPLFNNIQEAMELQLVHTTTFDAGAVVHYYRPQERKKRDLAFS